MIARAKFWIGINAYALLLDCLGLTAFAWAWRLFGTWPVAASLSVIIGAFVMYGGIGIHSTYHEKCRIYSLLLRRNRHGLRIDAFRDFMSVPCHRLVVRMVLCRLDRSHKYADLKRRFYVPPWQRRFSNDTQLIVFRSKEEGDEWLLQRNSKIA